MSPSESYTRRLHCVCVCVCLLELTTYHKFQMSTHKYFMRIKCPWPCALFSSAKNEIKGLLPDRIVGTGQEWRQLKSKHVQMAELIDGVRSKGHTRTVFIHHIDLAYDLSVKLIPCLYSCPAVVVSELRGYPVIRVAEPLRVSISNKHNWPKFYLGIAQACPGLELPVLPWLTNPLAKVEYMVCVP